MFGKVVFAFALAVTAASATAVAPTPTNLIMNNGTELVVGLISDALRSAGMKISEQSGSAKSRVHRRLQTLGQLVNNNDQPIQHDTETKLENAAQALALKLSGDGAGCAGEFMDTQELTGGSGGHETAAMRANQDKLIDTMKHFPGGGIYALGEWADDPWDCTCARGFYQVRNMCQCGSNDNPTYDQTCPSRSSNQGCASWVSGGSDGPCYQYYPSGTSSQSSPQHDSTPECKSKPMPNDAITNLIDAGYSMRAEKSGADTSMTGYVHDSGDDYSKACDRSGWSFTSCKNFHASIEITVKKGGIAPGTPDDDLTSTASYSVQVPLCLPETCFDAASDAADDIQDFIETITTALNADSTFSQMFELGDIDVGVGFCWPRWYNMVFMAIATILCLGCTVVGLKRKKEKNRPTGSGSVSESFSSQMAEPAVLYSTPAPAPAPTSGFCSGCGTPSSGRPGFCSGCGMKQG